MKNSPRLCLSFVLLLSVISQFQAQTNSWQFTGGPYFGAATSMVCSTSGHIFAGTTTGVFRSTDDGDTWTWVTESLAMLGVNTLMVKSDGRIFAGLSNGKVYCSSTNGDSWSAADNGLPGYAITDLKQKGTDSIVAGTMGGGIYISVNDGSSWTAINQGLRNTEVQSIAFKSDGKMFAGTTCGLYYSTDNGSQWDTLPRSSGGDVRKIAIDPNDNIFAINFPSFSGVDSSGFLRPFLFKLANNSDTWLNCSFDSIFHPAIYGPHGELLVDSSWELRLGISSPTTISIDQSGDIFVNDNWITYEYANLRHSSNSGLAWDTALISSGGYAGTGSLRFYTPGCDSTLYGSVGSMCFSPHGYVFVGTADGGIIRTTPSSWSTWSKVNTKLSRKRICALVKKMNGKAFAMTEIGIYRSSNTMDAWELIDQTHININSTSLAIDSLGDIYSAYGYVYRSTDEGNNWSLDTNGMTTVGPFTIQAITSARNGYLYAGSYFFNSSYRSMDLGASWQLLSSMPTCTTLTAARSGNLYAVEDAPATFSFSSDNGSTWTSKDYFGGLVDTTQYAITVFSTIQELSATSFLAGSNNGVFISNDTGNTWRNASQGLPYIPRSFLLSPAKPSFIDTLLGFPNTPAIVGNAHGVVFLGCSAGIYRSVDSGKTWQPYGQGMPSGVPINTLLMDNGGFLYAGTDDGTVFKTSQTTVGVIDPGETIPLDWKLEQNYPNPFNPSTIIGYQISKPSKVDLKVYDLLGREVALLVNEQKSAGRYEARWDASRFATGVYFATIRAGNFAKTIKLLLMK